MRPSERSNRQLTTSSLFGRISARASRISTSDCKVTIQLLNDSESISQEFKKNSTGQAVLDYICEYLNIVEKDYFGLRYQDAYRHRYWIDLNKPINKQVRGPNANLRFRVRFYPSDIVVIKEEITRYYLFVQLQRDLLHGRLYCSQSEAAMLGALILQSVIGDYNVEKLSPDYVSEYKLLLRQSAKVEEKMVEVHKTLKGYSAPKAEEEFVKRASKLETFGFDPYAVYDQQKRTVYLGVTHRGIFIHHANQMVNQIKWDQLKKVDYLGKELFIFLDVTYVSSHSTSEVNLPSNAGGKQLLIFTCPTASFAKHLWRHVLSQQAFFNENDAKNIKPMFSKPRIPLITRGSSFYFPVKRVLHEIELETSPFRDGPQPNFTRYELPRQISYNSRSLSTLPRTIHAKQGINTSETLPENLSISQLQSVDESEELSERIDDDSNITSQPPYQHPLKENGLGISNIEQDTMGAVKNVSAGPSDVSQLLSGNASEPEEKLIELIDAIHHASVNDKCSPAISIFKFLLVCLCLMLFLSAAAITVYEKGPNQLTNMPVFHSARHLFYDPIRSYLLNIYNH